MKNLQSCLPQANSQACTTNDNMVWRSSRKKNTGAWLCDEARREQEWRRCVLWFKGNWGENFSRYNRSKHHRSRIIKSSECWERDPGRAAFMTHGALCHVSSWLAKVGWSTDTVTGLGEFAAFSRTAPEIHWCILPAVLPVLVHRNILRWCPRCPQA